MLSNKVFFKFQWMKYMENIQEINDHYRDHWFSEHRVEFCHLKRKNYQRIDNNIFMNDEAYFYLNFGKYTELLWLDLIEYPRNSPGSFTLPQSVCNFLRSNATNILFTKNYVWIF